MFFRKIMRPCFFLFSFNFNIIVSHIFPENVIIKIPQVVQKIWRFSPWILALFIYFSNFLTFPYYKKTNGVTCNRWCQQFFTFQPSLNRLFNSTYLHVCAWYCHVSENIVKMRMRSRRDIVQLGNVSRWFVCHADGKKVMVVNLGYFSA